MAKRKDCKIIIRLVTKEIIHGTVNMGDNYNRVSDFVNGQQVPFLIVYNATINGIVGHELLINIQHIAHIDMNEKRGVNNEA